MIKKFAVGNLHGRNIDINFTLHEDLNVITGCNGVGKTTALKLMWYMISGNIERIFKEMMFDYAMIETTEYRLIVTVMTVQTVGSVRGTRPEKAACWRLYFGSSKRASIQIDTPIFPTEIGPSELVDTINMAVVFKAKLNSIFFPTFRRIEGGFSIKQESSNKTGPVSELTMAMTNLSRSLSTPKHQFVATISTEDINELITKRYASISKKVNDSHEDLSNKIIRSIANHEKASKKITAQEAAKSALVQARRVLGSIGKSVKEYKAKQEELLLPFSVLTETIASIFQEKSVRISKDITLGKSSSVEDIVDASRLSAGEKQMLSFLTYNTLSNNSVIFIDEPETSLHIDWQRKLFQVLLGQGKTNQFIIATHSASIYSKYADKELIIGE